MGLEIWIGTIEISYFAWEEPNVRKNAFTVVTTWATNADEFEQKCSRMLESYGWLLLGVEKASRACALQDFNDEVTDMLERTRLNPNATIYGTFYTYPVM